MENSIGCAVGFIKDDRKGQQKTCCMQDLGETKETKESNLILSRH
jgi:hypothetical protein